MAIETLNELDCTYVHRVLVCLSPCHYSIHLDRWVLRQCCH